jgi:hypothetical protein
VRSWVTELPACFEAAAALLCLQTMLPPAPHVECSHAPENEIYALVKELMGKPEIASDPDKFQELAMEAAKLQSAVESFQKYTDTMALIVDTRNMLRECEGQDEDMAEMARQEIEELEAQAQVQAHRCLEMLSFTVGTVHTWSNGQCATAVMNCAALISVMLHETVEVF